MPDRQAFVVIDPDGTRRTYVRRSTDCRATPDHPSMYRRAKRMEEEED